MPSHHCTKLRVGGMSDKIQRKKETLKTLKETKPKNVGYSIGKEYQLCI